LVAVQRLAELAISRRNTMRLMARGAHEVAAHQYPLIVAFHGIWLAAVGLWLGLYPPVLNPFFLTVYLVLQVARVWTILTLGGYWTTRIITLPDEPLVHAGPYRFIRHPNYVIVACEIAVLPLALGAWPLAAGFSLLHFEILSRRIRAEDAALDARR
jgi:methyltransferase